MSMSLRGRTAVVTGAASGIGRALAQALAQRGCHLALIDINSDGLAKVAAESVGGGRRISAHQLDIADAERVARLPEEIKDAHGGADLLINNAGVAIGGRFEEVSDADFEWLFSINFHGTVRMTRAFLPLLKASQEARIVNLSSIFGIVAPAGQVAYAASKFAVRGFSEGLRHELAGSSVGVTVVHPGGVATAIADSARPPAGQSAEEAERQRAAVRKLLKLAPEKAAERIVRGVERREARIILGSDAQVMYLLQRLMPIKYWTVLRRLIPH